MADLTELEKLLLEGEKAQREKEAKEDAENARSATAHHDLPIRGRGAQNAQQGGHNTAHHDLPIRGRGAQNAQQGGHNGYMRSSDHNRGANGPARNSNPAGYSSNESRGGRAPPGQEPGREVRQLDEAHTAGEAARHRTRDDDRDRGDYGDRGDRGGDYYVGNGRRERHSRDEGRPGSSGSGGGNLRRQVRERSRSPRGRPYYNDNRRNRSPHRRYSRDRYHDRRGGRHGPRDPPMSDEKDDTRTVFVQQLAQRLRTYQLKQFFESAGPVHAAEIVRDRVSGRSKGVGYVTFFDEESVQKAINLTGQKLMGIPIIAQLTEAEKNRQTKAEGSTPAINVPFHRLYVGNINFSLTEDDLKNVFSPFGELEFVQLQKEEPNGRSKGYGFVQYLNPAHAKEALEKMNNFELAGRPIRVGLGNDKFTHESTQAILRSQQFQQGSSFSGMGGRGAHAGGGSNFDRASGKAAESAGNASALDDTDVGGVNYNTYSRDSLMRKLARTEDTEPKTNTRLPQKKNAPTEAQAPPSRCVLLKNVYDQATETESDWQLVLKGEIKDECELKYGKVVHIDLSLDNDDGDIYVKFEQVGSGKKAIQSLNGRYFGGRVITAEYVIEAMYNANFPRASKV